MKLKRTAILLLTVALTLKAGTPRLRAFAQAAETATFTGLVLDAGRGVPGADVRLRLKGGPDIVASTNAGGRFVFTNLKPGSGVLIAVHGMRTATRFVRVGAGENVVDLDLDEEAVAARARTSADGTTVEESARPARSLEQTSARAGQAGRTAGDNITGPNESAATAATAALPTPSACVSEESLDFCLPHQVTPSYCCLYSLPVSG